MVKKLKDRTKEELIHLIRGARMRANHWNDRYNDLKAGMLILKNQLAVMSNSITIVDNKKI